MRCYKCDGYGEAACEHAKYDPMACNAQCSHPCVVMAETQRGEMERKLWDAESKLRQYREAVRPIVLNCRAILDALEAESKAAVEAVDAEIDAAIEATEGGERKEGGAR